MFHVLNETYLGAVKYRHWLCSPISQILYATF
jgi:hypothetical protein